ncbi:MAG TPA: hypothetical protein VKA96_08725, partial [Solirubrobacteraceae bacterium]|nr:hypothetical protein [Solirubrobacteraceae bacterium]
MDMPTRVHTAEDVRRLLEEQVIAVRLDRRVRTVERAKTIGYLARLCLQAIETADLVSRLEALEAVL